MFYVLTHYVLYCRYVTSVICLGGIQCSLRFWSAGPVEQQARVVQNLAHQVGGCRGIPKFYLNLARLIKLCSLPS